MDFYVDLAVAVLLRLLKDKRQWPKYRSALVKVHDEIEKVLAEEVSEKFQNAHPELSR